MKTLKKDNKFVRAQEQQVVNYLNQGYEFCPKSLWKEKIRDPKRATAEEKNAKKRKKKQSK